MQFRSSKCLFLGYSDFHKGYKCLSSAGRVYISDTVKFNPTEFPYSELFGKQASATSSPTSIPPLIPHGFSDFPPGFSASTLPQVPRDSQLSSPSTTTPCSSPSPSLSQSVSLSPSSSPEQPCSPSLSSPPYSSRVQDSHVTPTPAQHSSDTTETNTLSSPSSQHSAPSSSPSSSSSLSPSVLFPPLPSTVSSHPMVTRAKNGIFKPKVYNVSVLPVEPKNYASTILDPAWFAAMKLEYQALMDNNTWTLVPYDPQMKVK